MLKTRSLLVIAAATALLALPSVALADPPNVYFVGAPEATTGGCDYAHPCSVDYALSKAVSGDTVYVAHGTYVHSAVDTIDPTMNNFNSYVEAGVALVGAPGLPRPTIVQNDPYSHPTNCNCGVLTAFAGSKISHMRIVQHDPTAGEGAVGETAGVTIEDSELIGDGPGLKVASGAGTGVVRDSLLVSKFGMTLNSSVDFDQSTVVTQMGSALSAIAGSSTVTVNLHNSILHSDGTGDIFANAGTGSETINVDHSATRWSTATTANGAVVHDGGGNTELPPAFANAGAGDYHEALGSPTIDAGQRPVTALDLDGNSFTNGAPDIGAYEYYAPPPPPAPAPPAAKKLTGVKLSLAAKRKRGKVAVKITCPTAAVGTCGGSVALKQGHKTKTTKFSKVKPGKTKTLKIKAKRGRTQVTVTLTDAAGATGIKTLSKKLK